MPTLELLREADYTLNACGRPVPPPGYRFVDLPRVISYLQVIINPPGTPFQARLANTADTIFVCRGFSCNSDVQIRVRWPDGRFLNQNPSTGTGAGSFPFGFSNAMFAMNQERILEPDARVSIELAGQFAGTIKVGFWGVLRYLMKVSNGGSPGGASCIVGYPTGAAGGVDAGKLLTMPNPVDALNALPRLKCGPNQNIMLPEPLLGNQCSIETPPGYEDESFTFASDPITVPADGQNYGNVVIVPGGDDVVIRRVSAFVTFSGGLVSTIPTLAVRLPNGYSVTGGDQIPLTLAPGGTPLFPTLRIQAGGRLILDMADTQANPPLTGESTTVVVFDGVKRRRKVAA